MVGLKTIWKNIVSSGLQLLTIYFVFKLRWGQESWFKNKVSDALSLILMYGVLFICSILIPLIAAPVTVEIKQSNKHYETNETRFSINKRGKRSMEHERTVVLKVKVIRRYSIWGTFVAWIIKRLKIKVLIEPVTMGIVLQAIEGNQRRDIIETQTGFIILLDEYLSRIIDRSASVSSEKECAFIVIEDKLNPVSNDTIQITPLLLKNGQVTHGVVSLILGFKYDNHTVHFIKE